MVAGTHAKRHASVLVIAHVLTPQRHRLARMVVPMSVLVCAEHLVRLAAITTVIITVRRLATKTVVLLRVQLIAQENVQIIAKTAVIIIVVIFAQMTVLQGVGKVAKKTAQAHATEDAADNVPILLILTVRVHAQAHALVPVVQPALMIVLGNVPKTVRKPVLMTARKPAKVLARRFVPKIALGNVRVAVETAVEEPVQTMVAVMPVWLAVRPHVEVVVKETTIVIAMVFVKIPALPTATPLAPPPANLLVS